MKNTQIEGLRAISMCMVVSFHVFCRFLQLYCENDVGFMSWWGDFGAMCFLFISAFFLSNSSKKANIKEFFIRKVDRLWPQYFISITITFIILHVWYLPDRTCNFIDYVANIFWVNGFINLPYVDQAHWYITTLISFIIIETILRILKCEKTPEAYLIWMAFALLSKLLSLNFLYKLIGGSYVGVVGIAFSMKMILNKDASIKMLKFRICILLVVSFLYLFATKGVYYDLYIFIIVIMFSLAYNKKISFLENKLLQIIALYSYPIYLIHQNVAFCFEYQMLIVGKYSIFSPMFALVIVAFLGIFINKLSVYFMQLIRRIEG